MRTERTYVDDDLRYRVVEQVRRRLPPKPLQRTRYAGSDPDPARLLATLDDEHRAMAERVLREGARGWRRWSTIRRKAGPSFSPYTVEIALLDDLCRHAGLTVVDTFRDGSWVPQRVRVDDRVRVWLGIDGPELHARLVDELTEPSLLAAVEAGPPSKLPWRSFAFVLRACEQLHQFARHGVRPGARELAGLVDHTKAWTPARMRLVARLMGSPFSELVAPTDRQIALRGPVSHGEGGLWATRIEAIEIRIRERACIAVLVENVETFKHLLPRAEGGAILLQVPGGPPPAEVELVARLAALAPTLPFYAAFDLDPAGIRIARLVAERARIELMTDLMNPHLLDAAPRHLELSDWDHDQLRRLDGHAGSLEPLRAAIAQRLVKVEQETIQRELDARVERALVRHRTQPPAGSRPRS